MHVPVPVLSSCVQAGDNVCEEEAAMRRGPHDNSVAAGAARGFFPHGTVVDDEAADEAADSTLGECLAAEIPLVLTTIFVVPYLLLTSVFLPSVSFTSLLFTFFSVTSVHNNLQLKCCDSLLHLYQNVLYR